jgi:hypothetical protein
VTRHVTTCAVSALRSSGPGRSPERRSKGGSKATSRGSELVTGQWSSERWTGKGKGQRVVRRVTTCAVSVSRKTGPGRSPERRSQGGSKVTARRLELVFGQWSSDRWTEEGDGQRVIRHGMTRAVSPHGTASRVGRLSAAHEAARWRQLVGRSSSSDGGLRIAGRLRAKASGSSDT